MTGCYPPRVSHAFNHGPDSKLGLHPNEITIAEVLKDQGYATMCIGKWHLGDAPQFLPTRQGFDQYFGLPYSNDMWRYHPRMPPREDEDDRMKAARKRAAYTGYDGQGSYYPVGHSFLKPLPLMKNEAVIEEDSDQTRLTTLYTEEATRFMAENRGRPFFIYLAHSMPHVPLFVSEKHDGVSERGLYGDVIMEIDWSTGQIVDKVRELGLEEDTLIVFTSDNGPWRQYGIDGGSAGPLHGGKGSQWEGGMRVPAVMWWPGHIAAGRRTDIIAANMDLFPTFAHVAGAEVPADRAIDGRNLWPVISGETEESPHEYFYYFAGAQDGVNLRAVRDRSWKLFVEREGDLVKRVELYDLGGDVSETRNRIEDHPDIAQRLENKAQEFYNELVNNQRPIGSLEAR
jgi:arylsulfatase A-like enzyme